MDRETIKKVSEVARLNLTETELADFEKSFDSILEHFSILQDVKSENGEKTENAGSALRGDKESLDKDVAKRIMENVPDKEDNLFKVPKGSK